MNNAAKGMNTRIKNTNPAEPAGGLNAGRFKWPTLTGADIQIKERLPLGVASPQSCILATSLLPTKTICQEQQEQEQLLLAPLP